MRAGQSAVRANRKVIKLGCNPGFIDIVQILLRGFIVFMGSYIRREGKGGGDACESMEGQIVHDCPSWGGEDARVCVDIQERS